MAARGVWCEGAASGGGEDWGKGERTIPGSSRVAGKGQLNVGDTEKEK